MLCTRTTAAYIEGGKLVVRLGNRERLELPLPERALKWLQEKEREVAPLKITKIVRIQWREDRHPELLKVQIVLRVEAAEAGGTGAQGRAALLRGREQRLRDHVRVRGLRRHKNEGAGDAEATTSEQGQAAESRREEAGCSGLRPQDAASTSRSLGSRRGSERKAG